MSSNKTPKIYQFVWLARLEFEDTVSSLGNKYKLVTYENGRKESFNFLFSHEIQKKSVFSEEDYSQI